MFPELSARTPNDELLESVDDVLRVEHDEDCVLVLLLLNVLDDLELLELCDDRVDSVLLEQLDELLLLPVELLLRDE